MNDYTVKVNFSDLGPRVNLIKKRLEENVIGQEKAVKHLVRLLSIYEARLHDFKSPIGCLVFLGPTGVGKTEMAKQLARFWIGDLKNCDNDPYFRLVIGQFSYPLTIISGSEIKERHEIMKLKGAPPSYIGHDNPPLLNDWDINKYDFYFKSRNEAANEYNKFLEFLEKLKKINQNEEIKSFPLNYYYNKYLPYRSIVLIDEIEKAHPGLWQLFLKIFDDGQLILNNGLSVSFGGTLFILSGNIGSEKIQKIIRESEGDIVQIGFRKKIENKNIQNEIYKNVKKELKKVFPAEFIGRIIDEVVVFRPLSRKNQMKIIDLQLKNFENNFLKTKNGSLFEIDYNPSFKKFILKEGISPEYGIRPLKKTIEKYVKHPLANIINAEAPIGKVRFGDKLLFAVKNGKLIIKRKKRQSEADFSPPMTMNLIKIPVR